MSGDIIVIAMLFLATIYILLLAYCLLTLLESESRPSVVLLWGLLMVFIPVVGIVLWLSLDGVRFRRHHRADRRPLPPDGLLSSLPESARRVARRLLRLGVPILRHNHAELFADCSAALEEMFGAVGQARRSVCLESYILCPDEVGLSLCDLLAERARCGVRVRVLCDWLGSLRLHRHASRLRSAGVELRFSMRVRLPRLSYANHRNHRKMVITDGEIAFMGGINIAKRYLHGDGLGRWKDMLLKVSGEAVDELMHLFEEDWCAAGGGLSKGERDIQKASSPQERKVDEYLPMQIFSSGPCEGLPSVSKLYFDAVCAARHSVLIATPYFLPDASLLDALTSAARRGVAVRVMIPLRGDVRVAQRASCSHVEQLLASGVGVFFYGGGFNHSKCVVIDEECVFVGSANFDRRSFEDNFELTAVIYDPSLATIAARDIRRDMLSSIQVESSWWGRRPALRRVVEAIARLLSPYL